MDFTDLLKNAVTILIVILIIWICLRLVIDAVKREANRAREIDEVRQIVWMWLHTPAKCPGCNERLSTYVFPDDDMDSVVGLTCIQCLREWLPRCFLSPIDNLFCRQACIYHCGSQFFPVSPTAPSEEPPVTQVLTIDHLTPGDHICWPGLITTHHAIVMAVEYLQYTVVHFTRTDSSTVNGKCQIKKESISYKNHHKRGSCSRVAHDTSILYDTKVIISRAQFMYENRQHMQYSLLHYNCESLATFCATGVAKTFQGERGIWLLENVPGSSTLQSLLDSS